MRYRWICAGCQNGYGDVLYAISPYFAKRTRNNRTQILVNSIGGKAWINIDPNNILG